MTALLKTLDLTIGYQPPRQAVRSVAQALSLCLSAREMVCLIGPNGAGKSTLMRTLAGMQPPLKGRVVLGKTDLHRLTSLERAKHLSLVLTERPNVGLLSGYALVALGRHPYSDWTGRLTPYDEAVIRWAVDAVGAADLAHRPVMELSDGQRQKLMIARALTQEPQVILLDEPTAFLDLPRRVEMMQLLKNVARETGRAVLLSTHELDLALRTADTIWLMSEGRIYTGSPEDLILSGAFEAAFRSEGLIFNRETGSFAVHQDIRHIVAVSGEGFVHAWTRRAVERAGFALAHAGTDADVCIEIVNDDTQPQWTLIAAHTQTPHSTIRSLLQALTEHFQE